MTIKQFEDIEAWQLGRVLTRAIYRISRTGEFARDYALRDQIRRAALSITSNIAEGFERGGNREFLQARQILLGRRAVQYHFGFDRLVTRSHALIDVEETAQVDRATELNRNAVQGNAQRVGIKPIGDLLARAQRRQNRSYSRLHPIHRSKISA